MIYDPFVIQGSFSLQEIARLERIWLNASDFIVGYIEAGNPYWEGLSFEVGYIKAQEGKIYLISDKPVTDPKYRQTQWIREMAEVEFTSLTEAKESLYTKALERIGKEAYWKWIRAKNYDNFMATR